MPLNSASNSSSLESQFRALVKQWQTDTETDSSIARMIRHLAYQEIVGMGEPVVQQLRRFTSRLFVEKRSDAG